MTAVVWPGSPAATHITMLNTVGTIAFSILILVALIAGLLAILGEGQRRWEREDEAADVDVWRSEFLPETGDRAEADVDAAMVRHAVKRGRWGR